MALSRSQVLRIGVSVGISGYHLSGVLEAFYEVGHSQEIKRYFPPYHKWCADYLGPDGSALAFELIQ